MSIAIGDLILGKYVVEGILGSGSMGVVAVAKSQRSDKLVAVKVLADTSSEFAEMMMRRFEREAKLLSRVTAHPNIVTLYDYGFLDSGEPCLVMEYVQGTDLDRVLLSERALRWREAFGIVRQILSALDAVHDANVLHRDLKPSNILLTGYDLDVVKLADFGVAKPTDMDATRLTRTGRIVGTPLYMAPEQMLQLAVTPATDLYSLGLVIHQMVSGKLPFGTNIKGVRRRLREELPVLEPYAGMPPIHESLRQLVMAMTRIDPDERISVSDALIIVDEALAAPDPVVDVHGTNPGVPMSYAAALGPAHGVIAAKLGSRVLRRRPARRKLDLYIRGMGTSAVVDNSVWVAVITCDDEDTLEATLEALMDTLHAEHGDEVPIVHGQLSERLEPSIAWSQGELPASIESLIGQLA